MIKLLQRLAWRQGAALDAIDADALSPREALEQLYQLKQLAAASSED